MALGNLLILTQVIAYLLAVLFALFMFIPIAVNLGQFNSHCLLNAEGHWIGDDTLDIDSWGLSANCNFPIFVGVIAFPVALLYVLGMSVYLFRGTEPSWLVAFSSLIVNCVICLFMLISGSVVTHGFSKWCSLVEKIEYSCDDAQYVPNFLKDKSIDSGAFYIQFEISKFGAWASWICWIVIVACSSLQLYKFHRAEDFFTSMNRERQRLIQRVRHPDHVPI